MENKREIAIWAPSGATLGVIFHAALTARGWNPRLLPEWPPPELGQALESLPRAPVLAVIENDDATLARQLPNGGALDHVVCVGSISSIATLAELTARGATVFNQAAPILVLLELVQTALLASSRGQNSSPQGPPGGDLRLGELLERRKEAQRLALLTPAEIDTLRGIVGGLTATEIANQSHHSVHTVRSHIKAILSKLEVRTQVSAVAVAHRSASYRWMRTGPARFTNFGDEAG